MKTLKILIAFMLILISVIDVNGQIKISQLPTLSTPDSSADYIPIVHSGTTYKVTPGKLFHEFGASGGSGSPGGSNTQIQFNNSGAFGGSSDFIWDNAAKEFFVKTTTYPSGLFAIDDDIVRIGDWGSSVNETAINIYDDVKQIDFYAGGLNITMSGSAIPSPLVSFSGGEYRFSTGLITLPQAGVTINPYNTGAGQTGEIRFLELAAGGTSYTGFKAPDALAGNVIYTLPTADGTSGYVLSTNASGTLSWVANGGGGGSGTVTSIATTSPITGGTITTTGTIGIDNAAADGTTKGAASFSAGDFNASSGNITIDYANGQKAAADGTTFGFPTFTAADFNSSVGVMSLDYTNGQKATTSTIGFLTDTDWDTFNDKLSATGATTGATSQAQVFTSGIKTGLIDDNATSEIIFTLSTVQKASIDATGIGLIDGSAANPSYSWVNDKSTGLYLKTASSELGASVNGALVGGFNTTGLFTNTISEQTAASGVTIDGVLLKDGLVLGQYGGTGVANTGKTITLGGNLTTSGAHATTFTTTGTTGVTLPTTGTLATLAGGEVLTNKSIVATQLTGTAYTFAANNTNSTAAYTLQPYEDHPIATYSGTIDFNGTDPLSLTSAEYAWSRIGNTVTLITTAFWGTPGVTNTSVTFTLPSDCPSPAVIAGAGDAASEYMYPLVGGRMENNMTANPSAVRGGLRRNAANDGFEVLMIFGSTSAAHAQFTITYRTN